MRIVKCKVCGGTVDTLGGNYIKCDYCGQVYSLSGEYMSAEDVYNDAIAMQKKDTILDNENARMLLEGISGYKDSDEKALNSYSNIENIKIAAEEKRLKEERKLELERKLQEQKSVRDKKNKKVIIGLVTISLLVIIIVLMIMQKRTETLNQKYSDAIELYENGDYIEAEKIFEEISEYKDSKNYIQQIANKMSDLQSVYENAVAMYEEENYIESIHSFNEILSYLDSANYVELCANALYEQAKDNIEKKEYDKAKDLLSNIPEKSSLYNKAIELTKSIDEIMLNNQYDIAVGLYNSNELLEAQKRFMEISDYEDSKNYLQMIGNTLYEQAKSYYDIGDYINCVSYLYNIDEKSEWERYEDAIALNDSAKKMYKEAVETSALKILKEQSYNSFKEYLNNVICDLYSKEDANVLLEKWKPIMLSQLDVFNEERSYGWDTDYRYESNVEDNLGNIHNNVLLGGGYSTTYYINGGYDVLSGTAFILKEEASTKNELKFIVYGDGVELYRLNLTGGDIPESFNVNISDVTELKIYFCGYQSVINPGVGGNYGGIGEIMLYKAPK